MTITHEYQQGLILKINEIAMTDAAEKILINRAENGKPVDILLSSHNIAYANIINDDDNLEIRDKFFNLIKRIKAISPNSLIMIEAEGGTMQKIRIPLSQILFPANLSFTLFYYKLIHYFNDLTEETLINVIKSEIYIFFKIPMMQMKVNLKSLIEKYLQLHQNLSSEEKALEITCKLVEASYQVMGSSIKFYGIDVVLAPVANFYDGNAGSLQSRSFGIDPIVIAKFCIAALKGLKENGLQVCLKYFICQGQARDIRNKVNNSRQAPLSYSGSLEEIMQTEGLVFKIIFNEFKNIDFLMLSNITLTGLLIDKAPQPLPFSIKILQKLFKATDIPDNTVIITDDIFNHPIKGHLNSKQDRLCMSMEIAKHLQQLDRKHKLLIWHSVEDFDYIGGFKFFDAIGDRHNKLYQYSGKDL